MINDSHSNEIDFEERLSPHFTVGEMMRSGKAADIHVTGLEMCRKYAAILSQTDFDQMILEPQESIKKRWIHISYRRDGKNRHQILGAK